MVLSSSFDWTVKLWSPKFKNKPLITFESSDDYVYDVCWNRANPSLFSAVDGEGYIHLWDISKDTEAPILKYKAGKRIMSLSDLTNLLQIAMPLIKPDGMKTARS